MPAARAGRRGRRSRGGVARDNANRRDPGAGCERQFEGRDEGRCHGGGDDGRGGDRASAMDATPSRAGDVRRRQPRDPKEDSARADRPQGARTRVGASRRKHLYPRERGGAAVVRCQLEIRQRPAGRRTFDRECRRRTIPDLPRVNRAIQAAHGGRLHATLAHRSSVDCEYKHAAGRRRVGDPPDRGVRGRLPREGGCAIRYGKSDASRYGLQRRSDDAKPNVTAAGHDALRQREERDRHEPCAEGPAREETGRHSR